MQKEIWKTIDGFGGNYKVSSLGRVKSFHRYSNGRIISQNLKSNGYLEVSLNNDRKRTHKYVHRLVAEAFLNEDVKSDVNHINEIKTDNRVENLEWLSHKENINYGDCILKRSLKRNKPIIVIYPDGNKVTMKSINYASETLGISCMSISSVLKNKADKTKGFKFMYATSI